MLLVFHNNLQAAGGGTTYNQSVNGFISVSGTLSVAIVLKRLVTGSLTLAGLVNKSATYVRNYTSSLQVAGSLSTFFIAGGGGVVSSIRGGLRFMRKFLGRR